MITQVSIVRRKQIRYRNMVNAYQACHQRTQIEVTACSHDTGRTDTRLVNTRAAVLAIQQVTKVHGAVIADEAGRTETLPGAVTSGAVTTPVIVFAVRRGAGAIDVRRRTGAAVAVHQVVARAVVLTRTAGTFVYVRLTDLT